MGHTVLAVPVPVLDDVVRARTAFYDRSFVSDDPGFVHAHITVLAPWVDAPSRGDLATVRDIAARVGPARVLLEEVTLAPDGGVIYLRPEPDETFRALTTGLSAAFPDHPPYAGRFADPIPPHLTLDHSAGGVSVADVRERLAEVLPVSFTPDRLDLQWWANHDCRLLHSWPLGRSRRRAS